MKKFIAILAILAFLPMTVWAGPKVSRNGGGQPLDTELTAIAGLTFADKSIIQLTGASAAAVLTCTAANQLLGVNSANDALECKSTIQVLLDNSAAQIKDATDATKLLKLDPVGMTTGKTLTLKESFDQSATLELKNTGLSADSKTITLDLACTDTCTITGPTATASLAVLGAQTFTGSQTFTTSILPVAATTTIGSADAEWGGLYLGDGKPIYFQADQSVYLTPSLGTLTLTGAFAATGTISNGTANDPYIALQETDGTDWWIGINDTGNSLEFRSSATPGASIFYQMLEGGNEMLLSKTTVSFAADADTTLYTVPTGRTCVLTKAIVIAAANAVSTDISIGANGSETDWVGPVQMDNLDAAGDAIVVMPVPNATPVKGKAYAADTVIQVKVENQAGGAGNTIYLYGILY